MRKAHFLLFLAVILALSSCVTRKKLLYLQKEGDLDKKHPKDSITREYDLVDFNYKIQTNDIISVRYQSLTAKEFDIMQYQSQNNQNTNNVGTSGALLMGELVDEKGEIPIAVIGKVKVSGMTIFQAQDTIQKIANRYLESPIVKVRLLNFRITVLGEVGKEGTITFGNNRVTMMEAIASAGLDELADRSHVKLIRQTGSKTEVYYIDLLKEDFMSSPYYYVHQNDLIIVPPLRQRTYRKYFGQNAALILSTLSLVFATYALTKP